MITTRAVLLEIGNSLARARYRSAAISLLQAMETDPTIEIVPLSEELYQPSSQMYCDRPDKEWGLIDCVSFAIMSDRRITKALTADEHYQQAGFRALLRDNE
jgi:predicted nucleic acid-binding protein